jgi:hypothetical protein
MSDAVDSESIKFLEEVKKGKPRRFILLCKGSAIQRLVVFKKGSAESILQRTKKEGYKGQAYIGVVDGKGQDITFKLSSADGYDSEPGKSAFLKAFLSEAGIACKPQYAIVTELPQLSDEDDDSSTSTADAASAPKVTRAADPNIELRQKYREALVKLTPAVKTLVENNPDRRKDVLQLLQRVKDFAVGDPTIDKTAASEAIKEIQKLLAGAETPKAAASPSERGGERGRKLWEGAVETVLQQVETLKQAIADHEERSYQSLAKSIVATVNKRFDRRLAEACEQFDAAPRDNAQAVAGVIRDYAGFIRDDEMLKMLDDNPFDVKLSVRPTLAKALAEVEKCVKSPAKA